MAAALLIALPLTCPGQSQIPAAVNYQGRLTDTLGSPVSSGYYEVEFRIWDDAMQSGAGNLVWGRTFPVHVVSNGLFNILLTDDGGLITTPATPTNTLLSAFGGEDRYLGLTITTSNNVSVSNGEVSPRQQLVSAPYAIQAQTANTVGPLGVGSAALANGSVVTAKLATGAVTAGVIANGAVTEPKLANNAVTTAKIENAAVTTAKLEGGAVTTAKIASGAVTPGKINIDSDLYMEGYTLYLNPGSNHGLSFYGNSNTNKPDWAGINVNGAVLFGSSGGVLGTTSGGNKTALRWQNDQSVTAEGKLVVNGELHARNGHVSTFGPLVNKGYFGVKTQATTDGVVLFGGDGGHWRFRLWDTGNNLVWTSVVDSDTSGANGFMTTVPVAKGEYWEWDEDPDHPGSVGTHQIQWRPMGTD